MIGEMFSHDASGTPDQTQTAVHIQYAVGTGSRGHLLCHACRKVMHDMESDTHSASTDAIDAYTRDSLRPVAPARREASGRRLAVYRDMEHASMVLQRTVHGVERPTHHLHPHDAFPAHYSPMVPRWQAVLSQGHLQRHQSLRMAGYRS
jgi:hypothetical protein